MKPQTKNKLTNKQNQPEREAQAFFLLRMVVSSAFFHISVTRFEEQKLEEECRLILEKH